MINLDQATTYVAKALYVTAMYGYGRANYDAEWSALSSSDAAVWIGHARELLKEAGLVICGEHEASCEGR